MTSAFNPEIFLETTLTAPTEKRPPLPVGDYDAIIGEVTVAGGVKEDKRNPGTQRAWASWVVPLSIQVPPELQGSMSLPPSLTLTDRVFLDLNEAGNGLDMSPGRNGAVRRYREACDMNKPGDTFNPRAMQGRVVKVRIDHELYNNEIQERVKGVTRA